MGERWEIYIDANTQLSAWAAFSWMIGIYAPVPIAQVKRRSEGVGGSK